jgi:hypothetical protein
MQLTRELLDNEIRQAENLVEQTMAQLRYAQGGLSTLRQLRELLDKDEPECPPETH